MDEFMDTLGDVVYFNKLDAYSENWQMKSGQQDRPKAELVCCTGTFQCARIPFGLTNAPACFQRVLDFILTNYKWNTCLVYLEDIIIFSRNVEGHITHFDEILKTVTDATVLLKINECHFFSYKFNISDTWSIPAAFQQDATKVVPWIFQRV